MKFCDVYQGVCNKRIVKIMGIDGGLIHRTLKYKTMKDTTLTFYKTMVVPEYGSDTWVLSQRDRR